MRRDMSRCKCDKWRLLERRFTFAPVDHSGCFCVVWSCYVCDKWWLLQRRFTFAPGDHPDCFYVVWSCCKCDKWWWRRWTRTTHKQWWVNSRVTIPNTRPRNKARWGILCADALRSSHTEIRPCTRSRVDAGWMKGWGGREGGVCDKSSCAGDSIGLGLIGLVFKYKSLGLPMKKSVDWNEYHHHHQQGNSTRDSASSL